MNTYIETERLIIRDHLPEDFEAIWRMDRDPEVRLFTGGVSTLSRDKAYDKHLRYCNKSEDDLKEYAVLLKETGAYIGYCGFQYCQVLKGVEILYGYDKTYWGRGYAKEAAMAVLDYGLNQLKLGHVLAAVNYNNVGSDKVLQSIGMTYVGDIEWPKQGLVKKYEIVQ